MIRPRKLKALLAAEDGLALASVVGVMVVAMAFASTAALASVNALQSTVRNEDRRTALGAADAGVAAALARQNLIAGTGSNGCLQPGVGGTLGTTGTEPDGWCPAVSGSINGASYSYRTRPATDDTVRVLSTGASDGAQRRIDIEAENSNGSAVFGDAALIGLNGISMDSDASVLAGAATDGDITMASNALLCGDVSVGIGGLLTASVNAAHGGSACEQSSYSVNHAPLSLAPVQQGDVPTNNSNGRFFADDVISGQTKKVEWNASTRELKLRSNVALTLGGTNYSFCKLELDTNSTLFIAAGATVRIFFDTPEACGYSDGAVQLDMDSNTRIGPTTSNPVDLALLFVGSDTISTRMQFDSNVHADSDCTGTFVIYAPKTEITMNSNVTFCGAMAGKDVHMDSNSVMQSTDEVSGFQLPGAGPHYVASRFVECTVTPPTSDPGSGC